VTHIDHFIPWSRYPADLGHNFVLAHCSCNLSKGDKLAASDHLNGWVDPNRQQRTFLAEEFDRRKIIHDLDASERLHPGPTAKPPAQARSPGCAVICLFMWSRPGWRF